MRRLSLVAHCDSAATPPFAQDAGISRGAALSSGVDYAREICPVTTTSRETVNRDRRGRLERLVALQVTALQLLADRNSDLPLSSRPAS
jgi:hypothetical protein